MNPYLVPVVIGVPTLSLQSNVAKLPISAGLAVAGGFLVHVEGFLRDLTAGTFSIEIRSMADNRLLASLSWTAGGIQRAFSLNSGAGEPLNQQDDGVSINITGIGVGASGTVFLTLWLALQP